VARPQTARSTAGIARLAERCAMRPLLTLTTLTALIAGVAGAADARQENATAIPPQTAAAADQEPPPRGQFGLSGVIAAPLGDFHDNVEVAGGITGSFGVGVGASPVSLGLELTYVTYGGESRNLPVGGLSDLTVGVDTSNDIFLMHGRVRAQKLTGRVRPYVDGLVGFNYLVTSTEIDANEYCSSYGGFYSCSGDGDSVTHLDDLVFSGGGGGGVGIALTRSGKVRLDLSLRYLYGAEARYLTEGDLIWVDDGPPILHPRRTRTDMLLIGVGITFGR